MQINKITKAWLKNFADITIYQRGYDYNKSGNVLCLEYDPRKSALHNIQAKVRGSGRTYQVTIDEKGNKLDCCCNCPYDGYPCKHIIAVLLDYIDNKKEYKDQAKKHQGITTKMADKLCKYSAESLAGIIIEASQNIPDFELFIRATIEPDSQATLDVFMNRIHNISLGDLDTGYDSEWENTIKLQRILKATEKTNTHIQAAINWEIADIILGYLNDYGISDDEGLENIAIQTFETLTELYSQDASLRDKNRQDLIDQLQVYYDQGNCGIVDYISDLIDDLESLD